LIKKNSSGAVRW